MPWEAKSRTTILLPAPTSDRQFQLLDQIITEVVEFCGGATVSSIQPPVFDGSWLDIEGRPILDANVMITGDAPVPIDSRALATYLDLIKLQCQRVFQQDIIWITVAPVERVSTGDFRR